MFGMLVEVGAGVIVAPHPEATLSGARADQFHALALTERQQGVDMPVEFTTLGDKPRTILNADRLALGADERLGDPGRVALVKNDLFLVRIKSRLKKLS